MYWSRSAFTYLVYPLFSSYQFVWKFVWKSINTNSSVFSKLFQIIYHDPFSYPDFSSFQSKYSWILHIPWLICRLTSLLLSVSKFFLVGLWDSGASCNQWKVQHNSSWIMFNMLYGLTCTHFLAWNDGNLYSIYCVWFYIVADVTVWITQNMSWNRWVQILLVKHLNMSDIHPPQCWTNEAFALAFGFGTCDWKCRRMLMKWRCWWYIIRSRRVITESVFGDKPDIMQSFPHL